MATSRLINRNVESPRGRTSIRLEPEMWNALEQICHRQGISVADFIKEIDDAHTSQGERRTSAVRVKILAFFMEAATEEGHRAAGHGTWSEELQQYTQPTAAA